MNGLSSKVAKEDFEGSDVILLTDQAQIESFVNASFEDDILLSRKPPALTIPETTKEGESNVFFRLIAVIS
jgi:hypothetical protein